MEITWHRMHKPACYYQSVFSNAETMGGRTVQSGLCWKSYVKITVVHFCWYIVNNVVIDMQLFEKVCMPSFSNHYLLFTVD